MAPPVYSTRFIWAAGAGGSYSMSVPTGHVAVIRHLFGRNGDSVARVVDLQMKGWTIARLSLPVGAHGELTGMHLVAYENELVSVFLAANVMAAALSGYLYDNSGAPVQMATKELLQASYSEKPLETDVVGLGPSDLA